MQAIRVHHVGGPEQLVLDEIPTPEPGPGQVRVKIDAIGVNFIDVYRRKGQYHVQTPFTLGSEASGVVDKVGPGVTDVHVGQRVASASLAGAYAEYALASSEQVVLVPDGITAQQAAAAMLQGMTAHYLSHSTFPLHPGQTALIHAAGGGVGQLLVQYAKRLGARVIGTAGTERKAQLAREAGADDVILYTQEDFEAATKQLTGEAGVDVVYDSVGRDTFEKSLNCLKPRGYLVLYGQSSGPVAPVDPQTLNAKGSLFLTRPTLAHYIATHEELVARSNDVLTSIAQGTLRRRIDKTFPLAQAAEAHRYLEERKTEGKVLLIP
jgi:NADPH2:quinone reductase